MQEINKYQDIVNALEIVKQASQAVGKACNLNAEQVLDALFTPANTVDEKLYEIYCNLGTQEERLKNLLETMNN